MFLDWSLMSQHTEEHFTHTLTMIDKIHWDQNTGYRVTQRKHFISQPVVRGCSNMMLSKILNCKKMIFKHV